MSSAAGVTEAEIEAQVRRAIQGLIDATLAGDADRVLSFYRPDTPFIDQGRVTSRFDEMESDIRYFFENYRVLENTLDEVRVLVLSESTVVITAGYSYTTISTLGEKMTSTGAWSAVLARDVSGWRIIAPHRSAPHPIQ
jgi:uncharacterized protein (TIGR02246 family)